MVAESSVVMREAGEMPSVHCVVTQIRQFVYRAGSFVLHKAPETVAECALAPHRLPVVMQERGVVSQAGRPGGHRAPQIARPPIGRMDERSAESGGE